MSETVAKSDPWTTRRLMGWIGEAFTKRAIDSPRLCAEMLLTHVIGGDRLKLYTDPDRPASTDELNALRVLVGRALKNEPIQYLTGEAYFFGLRLSVDPRVLIPRPCTETIVETVISHLTRRARGEPDELPVPPAPAPAESDPAQPAPARIEPLLKKPRGPAVLIADVCTGSGAIAIALAKNLPRARIIATDISQAALIVAAANAFAHGEKIAERIEFLEGDLLAPLAERLPALNSGDGDSPGTGFDVLVSNPPYIPDHEWPDVPPNVKDHEPALALRGGPEGVDKVGPLVQQAPALLKPGGVMMIEIAACTAAATLALAQTHPRLEHARIIKDAEGHERFLWAQRRA